MLNQKYWEAKIPEHRKFYPHNFIDLLPFFCRKTGLIVKQDPNSKNVMLFITEKTKIKIHKWLKENKILLCNWQEGGTEDEITYQYIFRFKTEEDAMAVKLRWS